MANNSFFWDKIKIEANTSGDSRVAKKVPTIDEFDHANKSHQDDVKRLCARFVELLTESVNNHDWTKTEEPYRSMFYMDLCNTINGKMEFMDGEWAKKHYTELERHHLSRHCPDDVNLFDVIEMLCDCVAAGMARNAEGFYLPELSSDVLSKAFKNTAELLKAHVEVIDKNDGSTDELDDDDLDDDLNIPVKPYPGASFHDEDWYTCPRCGKPFEFYDAVYMRGFSHIDGDLYKHECGQVINME